MSKEITQARHTEEDKKKAVEAFYLTRSSKKASEICNIPASTIRRWKRDTVTWEKNMLAVKDHYNEQMDGKLTAILDKSATLIMDRLEKGDAKMTPKGDIVLVPVQARELASIQKQAFDQRAILRGDDPTKNAKNFGLEDLKNIFEASALAVKSTEERVINVEVEHGDERKDS